MPTPAITPPTGTDTTPLQLPRPPVARRGNANRIPLFSGSHAPAMDFRLVAVDLLIFTGSRRLIQRRIQHLALPQEILMMLYLLGSGSLPLKGQRYPINR